MLNKTSLLSFGAGILAGVVGHKLYETHKAQIMEGLGKISQKCRCSGVFASEGAAETDDVTMEELLKQKENLEDLIAEKSQKDASDK